MSLREGFALVQASTCPAALVDAEQEQPGSGFTDIPVPVRVCFTRLSGPSSEVERSENRHKARLQFAVCYINILVPICNVAFPRRLIPSVRDIQGYTDTTVFILWLSGQSDSKKRIKNRTCKSSSAKSSVLNPGSELWIKPVGWHCKIIL